MFYLSFCNKSDWLFVCVKSCLVSDYVSTLAQSRSLSLIYWQKLSATCRKETMKEAKTIAQARQPPSCGSPTSITFSQLHSIGFLAEKTRKFILSVRSSSTLVVSSFWFEVGLNLSTQAESIVCIRFLFFVLFQLPFFPLSVQPPLSMTEPELAVAQILSASPFPGNPLSLSLVCTPTPTLALS